MTHVVKYFHEIPNVGHGNIVWRGSFPMRQGRFPADHPASPLGSHDGSSQLGNTEKMIQFRARGYWASCFPEGDGITMHVLNGQDAQKVASDIADVFGWTVSVERS